MSRIQALRTYTFVSAEVAAGVSTHFKHTVASMKREHDTLITNYWFSRTNPAQIYALVHYPPNSDPDQIKQAYVTSEAFKQDTGGADVSKTIVGFEEVLLDPIPIE